MEIRVADNIAMLWALLRMTLDGVLQSEGTIIVTLVRWRLVSVLTDTLRITDGIRAKRGRYLIEKQWRGIQT